MPVSSPADEPKDRQAQDEEGPPTESAVDERKIMAGNLRRKGGNEKMTLRYQGDHIKRRASQEDQHPCIERWQASGAVLPS